MNKRYLMAILSCLLASPCLANDPNRSDLVYDPADGSLTIVNQTGFALYAIKSETGAFLEDPDPAPLNHVRWMSGVGVSTPNEISESNPFKPVFASAAPTLNLGLLLPPGLTEDAFVQAVTIQAPDYHPTPYYLPGFEFTEPFELVYLPEPGTFAGFTVGFVLLSRRRR